MNNLYQNKNKIFPTTVRIPACAESEDIAGNNYIINADYRTILRIFAVLHDRDVPEYKRIEKLIQWFFAEELPENVTFEAINQAFVEFVNPHRITGEESEDADEEPHEQQYDYDFDADEIYASFLEEYGIDLVEVEFLHWYKFKLLLSNLSPDSAFKRKIELRFMDLKGFKGQALSDAMKAKESVQLPVELSEEELREQALFESSWGRL